MNRTVTGRVSCRAGAECGRGAAPTPPRGGACVALVAALVALLALGSCENTLLKSHIVRMSTLAATDDTIFVSSLRGDDDNPGTIAKPKRSINAAIDVFAEDGLVGSVLVAGGTYEVNYYEGTHIVLVEGVSLCGGYTEDFAEVDGERNPSIVQDLSRGPTEGTSNPYAVYAGKGLTRETRFEGFTVIGGSGQTAVGLMVEGGSPTIAQCVIHGGSPTAEDDSWTWASGILVRGGGPVITGSEIGGSRIPDTWYSSGVAIEGASSFEIDSCTVSSGTAVDKASAVWVEDDTEGLIVASALVAEASGATQGLVVIGSRVNLWDSVVRADSVDGEVSEGVRFDDADGDIGGNDIRAGYGSVHSMGVIATNGSRPYIIHNSIAAGGGGNYSSGINLEAAGTGWIGVGFNTVFGGTGVWANAIYAGDMQGRIFANLLHGGGAGAHGSRGIRAVGARPEIENNTIYGGSASAEGPEGHSPNSIGISCEPSQPDILSNIIFAGGSGGQTGINANDDLTGSVAHNLFYSDTGSMSLYDGSVGYEYEELGLLETDRSSFEDNVIGDPKFADQDGPDNEIDTMDGNDWHLTAETPVEIREGGFVSGEGYVDPDETPRTEPCSIGAYEYD